METNKKEADRQLHLSILRQMVALSTSGLGLVAALAWNNVIKELVDNHIKPYLPQGSSLISLFVYAIAITALAVVTTYNLTKVIDKLEKFSRR